MSLKEVKAFMDNEGKLWKTQGDYDKHREVLRRLEETKLRNDLARRIAAIVYPRNHVVNFDHQVSVLEYFLQRLSLEDLQVVEKIFIKHLQNPNNIY